MSFYLYGEPFVKLHVVKETMNGGKRLWTVARIFGGKITSHSGEFTNRREAELHMAQLADGSFFRNFTMPEQKK